MKNSQNKQNQIPNRSIERQALFLVTLVLCLAFFTLYNNLKQQFDAAETGYADQTAMNLDKGFNPDQLSNLLVSGNYITDKKDADLIAQHLSKKLNNGSTLPNLGALNKQRFRISASYARAEGGSGMKVRVEESLETLGVTDEVKTYYSNINTVSEVFELNNGDCKIEVRIQQSDSTVSRLDKITRKQNKKMAGQVLVRLKEHFYIKTYNESKKDTTSIAADTILGYALTNDEGIAVFSGLNKDKHYSVLPVKEGYEYGSSKGVRNGSLGKNRAFGFSQREHNITPFDALSYAQLKENTALTVRTPGQFKDSLIANLIFFLIAWWLLHLFFCIRKKDIDRLLLPVLMTLSGLGLLMMYAIINPLTDTLMGDEMIKGGIAGVFLIAIISEINFVALFNSQYQWFGGLCRFKTFRKLHYRYIPFDPLRQLLLGFLGLFGKKVRAKATHWFPEGCGYLFFALILAGLLFPFGDGPEGSDVKVNLFFFQPSEITKFLIIIFLAAFFTRNAAKLQTFSGELDKKSLPAQLRTIAFMITGIGALLIIYLKLGDMGPALVLTITFIIIYSIARHDFPQLLTGAFSFITLLWIGARLNNTPYILSVFAVLWFVLWIAYGIIRKKQIFESAIFLNLVIAAFIFGSNLPNVGQRLQDRNEIFTHIWDNEVRGGDHIAQGLWSLSSGGPIGQGLGEGNPNLVPAFHTDMIFASISEELGLIGLVLIILCMAILLHRSLLIGRKTGNPFAFYLATGIAVVTGVQFLLITMGCIGLIPLTGVSVPFLSFGKTSLVINLAAFGMVLAVSKEKATDRQKKEIKNYDSMVASASLAYTLGSLILFGSLVWYQVLNRDYYLTRPAFVTNRQGARIAAYNPRIRLLVKKIDAGNIYDRNGLLLATNDKDIIRNNAGQYITAGVKKQDYETEINQRKQRYYPFGKHLFFWLGDFNIPVLWNDNEDNPYGYMAERRHLAALRGFDNLKYDENNHIRKIELTAKKYKGSPFLYQIKNNDNTYIDYDYSTLLPMLKDGLNGEKVRKYNENRQDRDITLTVDAALQTKMQHEIGNYATENFKSSRWSKLRVSVVVLNAHNGDLLCSANYPLPDMELLKEKQEQHVYAYSDSRNDAYTDRDLGLTYQTAPGSTAKVMSALAGLQKLGAKAANKTYYIDARETVEPPSIEPNFQKDGHNTTMEEAIRLSSNNYFINLINDQELYLNLDSIYQAVGIRINKPEIMETNGQTIRYGKPLTPYFLTPDSDNKKKEAYRTEIKSVGEQNIRTYRDYIDKREKHGRYEQMSGYHNGHDWNRLAWAWGQNDMGATPLNMARITAIVANEGILAETQFIRQGNKNLKIEKGKPIRIVNREEANILKGYMQNESMKHHKKGYAFPTGMGGKTGTPERGIQYKTTVIDKTTGKSRTRTVDADIDSKKDGKMNDGWYIFFIDSPKENAPLAIAIRMERLGTGVSGNAVRLADKVVINKVLRELEYIK